MAHGGNDCNCLAVSLKSREQIAFPVAHRGQVTCEVTRRRKRGSGLEVVVHGLATAYKKL